MEPGDAASSPAGAGADPEVSLAAAWRSAERRITLDRMPTKRSSPKPKRPALTARELELQLLDRMTPRERAYRALELGRLSQRLAEAQGEDGGRGEEH